VIPAYLVFSLLSRRRFYLIAGLIVALALSPLIIPRVAKERIAFTFMQPETKGQIQFGKVRLDTSASARVIGYKQGLSDWRKSPILGYGVTGYIVWALIPGETHRTILCAAFLWGLSPDW
jgi:O-antigen ligase